jgi:hypothetical protein
MGLQGPQGLTGVQGESGEQGATGRMGVTGPQGIPGPVGPTGEYGPLGATGPRGQVGCKGLSGASCNDLYAFDTTASTVSGFAGSAVNLKTFNVLPFAMSSLTGMELELFTARNSGATTASSYSLQLSDGVTSATVDLGTDDSNGLHRVTVRTTVYQNNWYVLVQRDGKAPLYSSVAINGDRQVSVSYRVSAGASGQQFTNNYLVAQALGKENHATKFH